VVIEVPRDSSADVVAICIDALDGRDPARLEAIMVCVAYRESDPLTHAWNECTDASRLLGLLARLGTLTTSLIDRLLRSGLPCWMFADVHSRLARRVRSRTLCDAIREHAPRPAIGAVLAMVRGRRRMQ
jgi:hypothetical protein